MVFEAWLTDGNYAASGYPLSLGQFIRDGTLSYNENLVNSYTFTDITVTMEPRDDKDPKPAWSNAVGAYLLAPPFGQ
jgi:cellulase/cellobiase CelA1